MGYTLTEKILRQHIAEGFYEPAKKVESNCEELI